ncbi:MAG: magnesium transporter [Oscillospiraceae bacterium]|jgi:magnesium transporter|nr:magnesium transporter [Oscillospiraceae bacterium]MCX4257690.1 magnesium transporter [Oscillospiraceae bacterium]
MEKELAIELIGGKQFVKLKSELQEMNPADIAFLVEELNSDGEIGEKELILMYRILPKELAAEAFTYMDSDTQITLINAFSDRELRYVLDELYIDDTVDIIEEMPANVVSRILRNTDSDTRKQINQLLNYPKDSAGSVMTTEFVYLKKELTVSEAFEQIRKIGLVKETVYTCYVTENRRLLGIVTVLDMLVADSDTAVEDIMETNVISVNTHDDREYVARTMSKYDFAAIPVVDNENRIVGIVTFDDAMDVLQEENTEDFAKMAAVVPAEDSYFKTSVWSHAKSRIPWLLILMLSATLTGMISASFEPQIAVIPMLVSFMPMVMGTGGNCGSQSSTLIIRGMAIDEIRLRDFFKVVFKEFRIALICAAVLSVVNSLRVLITYKDPALALVIGLSLIGTVVIAKLVGAMLPMGAKALRLDPAIMANPLITTVVDSCSLLIYFTVATNILSGRL